MLKRKKLDKIPASKKIYTNKGYVYAANDSSFLKSTLDGSELETFDFHCENQIYTFKSDVLAYIDDKSLKVDQLKKDLNLVSLSFVKNRISSIALSPSALHTIIGNEDGTVNVVHNISASSILKFTLFSNGDAVEFVDFLEENIIMGSTKKHILLINILEKGVIAKIAAKGIITSIITSNNKIIYATREKDIYLVDIKDLTNISTTRITSLEDNIEDLLFSFYKSSIFARTKKSLFQIDFESNIETLDVDVEDASNISIIDSNSLIIGFESSSTVIEGIASKKILEEDEEEAFFRPPIKPSPKVNKNLIRFLTVDDSATIRLVIKKSIMNNFKNVEVHEANDGLEAMAHLSKNPNTDVVLLDWNMPNMNGEEVVNAVSKISELSHVKIIMATTEGAKDKVTEMLSKGVKGYLVKPFRPNSVIPMVEKLIELIQNERIANE